MFTHWPVYALAAGGVAALFLEQAALHVGPLRVSQPFLVIIDPVVSIALSVRLFGEHFTANAAVLAARRPCVLPGTTGWPASDAFRRTRREGWPWCLTLS